MGKLTKKDVFELLKDLKRAETDLKELRSSWGKTLFDSRVFNGSNMSKQAKHDFNNRLYSYSSLDDDFLLSNSQEPLNFD